MERRERRNAVTVLAPAKLNLALDVVGLLPNGYHALDMTMQTITLYERVVLRRSAGLSLQLPGSPVQPNDKNTAIKAALAFFHYTGLLAGVDIIIHKNLNRFLHLLYYSTQCLISKIFKRRKKFRFGCIRFCFIHQFLNQFSGISGQYYID